jgi:hypothetical protein
VVEADLFRFLEPLVQKGLEQISDKDINKLTRLRQVASSSCECWAQAPHHVQEIR